MNVKEIHKFIKSFLLRLRLRLASDGWRVTLVHKPDGTQVHLVCEDCHLVYNINTMDEIAWVLRRVLPDYGVDMNKHKRVVVALQKRFEAITRKTYFSESERKGA